MLIALPYILFNISLNLYKLANLSQVIIFQQDNSGTEGNQVWAHSHA